MNMDVYTEQTKKLHQGFEQIKTIRQWDVVYVWGKFQAHDFLTSEGSNLQEPRMGSL